MNYSLKNMTIEEKLGQLIMFGFHGTEVTPHALKMIEEFKVGNVILFAQNCQSPKQIFKMNQELQRLAHKHLNIPMFISVDQEGGMVTRIFHGATFFPGAMTISATNNHNHAYQIGKIMGLELEALGMNMNLAPVLDVNNNPKNPVIGVRSYSDQPEVVSLYGSEFIRGLQESVIATAKHFPGHGDTHVDSHLALPKVDYPISRLESVELIPFTYAIEKGIKAIMSSHIDFPQFTENGLPTTLSKKWLTTYLRETLHFEGLIVTDGMEMKAIQDHYGTVEATLMAILAGANQVCICHSEKFQIEAMHRLKQAVINGELPMDILDERVKRVLEYKKNLKEIRLDQTYESVKDVVENKQSKDFVYHVVEKALTLVKGKTIQTNPHALFIGILPKATTGADDTDGQYNVLDKVIHAFPKMTHITAPLNPTDEEIKDILNKAKSLKQIILCTYNGNIYQQQIKLMDQLSKLQLDLHVIAMRNPYDLYYAKDIDNYVCLYEYTPNAIKVLLAYLKGEILPKGRMPVKYE
jgi:beta-N-acetylhexosaminidase